MHRCRIDDPAILDVELLRRLLQDSPRNRKYICFQLPGSLQCSFPTDAGPTACVGGTAMRRRFGVAGNDLDAIAVDTEMFGHDLPDNRFSALPELRHRNQAANI